jgi:tetratricopeptide (TPR) repeat protein
MSICVYLSSFVVQYFAILPKGHYVLNTLWRVNLLKKITFLLLVLFVSSASMADFSLVNKLSEDQISQAYYKSYTYEKSGNYNDAIKSIQLVYQRYEATYGVNNRLGKLFRMNAQYRNSISHYKKAIKALPNAISPKLGLMYSYLLAKNYEAVNKVGYQVISTDYYNYYGNFRLAVALRQLNKLDLAEKILIKMLIRYPGDTLYLTQLGLLNNQQKKYLRAKAIFKEVLILDPENVNAKTVLGTLIK